MDNTRGITDRGRVLESADRISHMLALHNLACRRGLRTVFRDISLTAPAGCLMQITGVNGSGKSSLLRCIAGLLPVTEGHIAWQGGNIATDRAEHQQRLHYIGHLDALKPELTVSEMIAYWRALRPLDNARPDGEDWFGLRPLMDKPIRYLSAGQKRRLSLSRLLQGRALLWLLDEPANALDADGQRSLARALRWHCDQGGIALAVTHHPLSIAPTHDFAMPEKAAKKGMAL